MPGKTDCLKYKNIIQTTPAEAYRAFTSSTALTEWLCNQALVKPISGGSLYLNWQNGYYVCGEFIEFSPEKSLAFSWRGKGDPGVTTVRVTFKEKKEGLLISLTHCGLGEGKKWKNTRSEIDKGWQESLENLKSTLESGQDLRILRRPMMGITGVEAISEDIASKLNLPKMEGLLLYGVLEGMGAHNAGLQSNDVLVKMGGEKLKKEQDLIRVIGKHQAGDVVKIVYLRNGEKLSAEMTFSERFQFDVAPDPVELASQIDAMFKPLLSELDQTLKSVTNIQASFSEPGEWSIKQVLAHLIATEKDTHTWIAALIEDQENSFEYHVNKTERLNAITSAYTTLNILIQDLKRDVAETVAMISNLPPDFVHHKRSYNRLGNDLLHFKFHYQDHINQIQKILAQEAQQVNL